MPKKILTTKTDKNGLLFRKCEPVTLGHPRDRKFVEKVVRDLTNSANENYGLCLGLSANQLGYMCRVFVMRTEGGPFFHVINPEIISMGGGVKSHVERCLSLVDDDGNLLPGTRVRRPKWIKVRVSTLTGRGSHRHEELELKGINARVFLHELDHLNGKVI